MVAAAARAHDRSCARTRRSAGARAVGRCAMMALVGVVVLVGVPVATLVGVLALVDLAQRRRADVIARQIAVTDAIHAEFGAIVAPTVRRAGRGWRVTLPMDARHPGIPRVMELARCTLGPTAKVEVAVVTPWIAARRVAPQNRERIASAMSA